MLANQKRPLTAVDVCMFYFYVQCTSMKSSYYCEINKFLFVFKNYYSLTFKET